MAASDWATTKFLKVLTEWGVNPGYGWFLIPPPAGQGRDQLGLVFRLDQGWLRLGFVLVFYHLDTVAIHKLPIDHLASPSTDIVFGFFTFYCLFHKYFIC